MIQAHISPPRIAAMVMAGLILLAPASCTAGSKHKQRADDSAATPIAVAELASANNRFALDIYRQLAGRKPEDNLFLSPYSVFAAFGMVYQGAGGDTASQIAQVLNVNPDGAVRNPAFAALYNKLNPDTNLFLLSTANALWVDSGFPVEANYLETVKRYFAGNAENLDIRTAPEKARQTINAWVEERTSRKIKNLIPQGGLSSTTVLVITNAIYFKGDWVNKFDKTLTRDADFHVSPYSTVTTPMMETPGMGASFHYGEVDGVKMIRMPYRGEAISMLVAMPQLGGMEKLESSITVQTLERMNSALSPMKVKVRFPKFTMTRDYSLSSTLKDMGMGIAFGGYADFSGISPGIQTRIENVFHKAYIDVHEEGTEAAGATGVGVGVTSAPLVQEFAADRPFLFFLMEESTGAILFMGKMADPGK